MVDQLDIVFRALADPTRRAMVQSLAAQPRTVSELAEPFEISLAAASKHIQVLERAGIVHRTIRGRTHVCRLDARPMRAGVEWMRRYEQFWNDRLDALEAQLRAEDASLATASRAEATPPAIPIESPRPAPRGPRIASRRHSNASKRKGS